MVKKVQKRKITKDELLKRHKQKLDKIKKKRPEINYFLEALKKNIFESEKKKFDRKLFLKAFRKTIGLRVFKMETHDLHILYSILDRVRGNNDLEKTIKDVNCELTEKILNCVNNIAKEDFPKAVKKLLYLSPQRHLINTLIKEAPVNYKIYEEFILVLLDSAGHSPHYVLPNLVQNYCDLVGVQKEF